MTIDEVIAHERDAANKDRKCEVIFSRNDLLDNARAIVKRAEEHEQLAEWLEELKRRRMMHPCGSLENEIRRMTVNDFVEKLIEELSAKSERMNLTFREVKDMKMCRTCKYYESGYCEYWGGEFEGDDTCSHYVLSNDVYEWEYSPLENIAICSKCRYEHYLGTYHQYATNYCPNCGQRMKQVN